MIKELAKYQHMASSALKRIGFLPFDNDDFTSVFAHPDGFRVTLECERYNRDLVSLSLFHPHANDYFDVSILMDALLETAGPPKTLQAQVEFLVMNFDTELRDLSEFEDAYNRVDFSV